MKISELISELEAVEMQFGDIAVCIAQLQNDKRRTVRLTAVQNVYFQYGVVYVTNLSEDGIGELEGI
jgi:hypothetical protein